MEKNIKKKIREGISMKKKINMHHDPMIKRAAYEMQGFLQMSSAFEATVRNCHSLNNLNQYCEPAQIEMKESKIMKFFRNL